MIGKLLLTCGLFVATACLGLAETEIGKTAPNFTLPDTNGKKNEFGEFQRKIRRVRVV